MTYETGYRLADGKISSTTRPGGYGERYTLGRSINGSETNKNNERQSWRDCPFQTVEDV
jgi:hypothetical protein